MDIVVVGWIGLEGTSVIAENNQNSLRQHFSEYVINKGIRAYSEFGFFDNINLGNSMELGNGGIFAGLWRLSKEMDLGFRVELSSIPIRQETIELCEYYDINPYRLYSGGSLLAAGNIEKIQNSINSGNCTVIGNTLDCAKKVIHYDENTMYLNPPVQDEMMLNINKLCGYI